MLLYYLFVQILAIFYLVNGKYEYKIYIFFVVSIFFQFKTKKNTSEWNLNKKFCNILKF